VQKSMTKIWFLFSSTDTWVHHGPCNVFVVRDLGMKILCVPSRSFEKKKIVMKQVVDNILCAINAFYDCEEEN
jgi:hypothetical protein